MVHSHRSTLKSKQKSFKSKHATKSALKAKAKGRVEKSAGLGKKIGGASKAQRKNFANQIKQNKIQSSQMERKLLTGPNSAERIVTIVSLASDVNSLTIANQLLVALDEDLELVKECPSVTTYRTKKFRTAFKFILPDQSDFISILDACKVSDFVILGLSATEEVDPKVGEQIIRAIELQGIATVMGVIPNLVTAYPKKNLQLDVLKSLESFFNHFFPSTEKLFSLENSSEALNAIRTVCQKLPKSVTWRDSRGYMVVDKSYWQGQDNGEGFVVLEGIVRGSGFNVDRLVHLPGYGDYQLAGIEIAKEALQITPSEAQESLEELAPEQFSVPDDEEFSDDELNEVEMDNDVYNPSGESKRKLPKGLSEYQSRWYLDEELEEMIEEVGEDTDDESVDEDDDDMDIEDIDDGPESRYEPSEMHVELSQEEEDRQLQQFKQRERDDMEFPDEIEIDPKGSARDRLRRYRGVKSLSNCDWDYDEKDERRPSEWKRLLRVSNFKTAKQRLIKEYGRQAQAKAGDRVRLFIKAPAFVLDRVTPSKPFIVYGLLEHEHQLSTCHFVIQTWEDYEKPLPSKDTLIVQYGPRRHVIQPIFSNVGNNSNNVHRFQRFLHKGTVAMATAILPPVFPNTPAIFYKQSAETGQIELVAQGTFENTDHTRIVVKRAVVTGEPFKIHKKMVTIRYMFFNVDDVNEYKDIPLFTKMGRSGFIRESLGTHGYFKATFDGKLNPQDTIGMALYKRIWPRGSILHNA
ncbi:unnamed protein product [Kuraishia capsulata CBS 1993]|uniref:Bms1-type G domain-containing protein n=1 Tax=Kuraishia capsulata CBS 1993 TaxID=1382522 RepID=W6MUP5_9ASCO|nr:uncharacterized protein KUCA_T00001780001 [Kuraishia capsulata CBS 1993]CDK25810.1 unnamed protein product [Kuraishia capsulata CBS 1993]